MAITYDGRFFETRLEAIEYAVTQMDWLTTADAAQVDICRAMAEDYDALRLDPEKRKDAAYVLRELKNCLAALGGSPESRKELGAKDDEDATDPAAEKLKAMKAKRAKK